MRSKKLIIGLRCGYAFRFFQTKWSLENNANVDLPKPSASSPFVAFILRIKSRPQEVCCVQKVSEAN
jgi:hypothetical protein